jgi:hypothetical protein
MIKVWLNLNILVLTLINNLINFIPKILNLIQQTLKILKNK